MVIIYDGNGGWPINWPHILTSRGSGKLKQGGKQNYATQTVRDHCGQNVDGKWVSGEMIVDSAFGDPFVTNKMVIDTTLKINADIVVPKDYPNDVPKTITSIREFYQISENCLVGHLIPLQHPYEDCFDEIRSLVTTHGDRYYGIGGLVGLPEDIQYNRIINAVEMLHQKEKQYELGGTRIHLFGIYPTGSILDYIHEYPDRVYSLDTTVCENQARYGKILDMKGEWHHVGETLGKHSTPMKHILAFYNLTMLNAIVNFPDLGQSTGGKGGAAVFIKHPPKKRLEQPLF
jgi:hypothetical protein